MKDLVGCDDVACMADVVGALGADYIIAGQLAKVFDDLVLSVRVVSAPWLRGRSRGVAGGAPILLEVMASTDETEVSNRWREAPRRGPTWKQKLLAGRKALLAAHGDTPFGQLLRV